MADESRRGEYIEGGRYEPRPVRPFGAEAEQVEQMLATGALTDVLLRGPVQLPELPAGAHYRVTVHRGDQPGAPASADRTSGT